MLSEKTQEYIQKIFQIPCASSLPPQSYIIVLDINSRKPAEKELKILASYQMYVAEKYRQNPGVISCDHLQLIPGFNTYIFLKGDYWPANGSNGWSCRRMYGDGVPLFTPAKNVRYAEPPPWKLTQLLCYLESGYMHDWARWRTMHNELFS